MKLQAAMDIINESTEPKGFRVHFERSDGHFLTGDYFPERDEPLIETEQEAWELAVKFAEKTRRECVNVYVVDDRWCPVKDYAAKKIPNR